MIVIYEHPFTERVRLWLKLEQIFLGLRFDLHNKISKSVTVNLFKILELLDLFSAYDIKSDLLKELTNRERSLYVLVNNPAVDQKRLSGTLKKINHLKITLKNTSPLFSEEMRKSELLSAAKQSSPLISGPAKVDSPLLKYWLSQSSLFQLETIEKMFMNFNPFCEALSIILALLRESSIPIEVIARNGKFERAITEKNNIILLRIALKKDDDCFPEFLGNKHRIQIKFLNFEVDSIKPKQLNDTINFKLSTFFF